MKRREFLTLLGGAALIDPQAALALSGPIIHDNDERVRVRTAPGETDEAVPGSVPIPCGCTLQQLPLALDGGIAQTTEQTVIELVQLGIDRFTGSAPQMNRNLLFPTLHLALVDEAEAWGKESQYGCRLVGCGRECGSRSWLVVVLKKSRGLTLKIHFRSKMIANRPSVSFAEAVV